MNPNKFAELQLQMKQNQHELGDYLKDLDDWTQEMKKKEDDLLHSGTQKGSNVPPVRNLAVKSEAKSKEAKSDSANKNNGASNPKKLSSYDYRAWDRFDVDAALKSSSSGSEDEGNQPPARSNVPNSDKQAVALKEKGNELYSQKNYSEAIECYSSALKLQPRNATFLSNRAICYLKLERFQEAEDDCTNALASEPRNTKALFRRATARVGLGKLEEASEDFESVLNLEPSNKLAQQEIDRIKESTRISKAVEMIVEQEALSKIPEWFPLPPEDAPDFAIMPVKSWKGSTASDEKLSTVPIREAANLSHLWKSSSPTRSGSLSKISKHANSDKEAPRFVYAPPPCSWRGVPEVPTTSFQFQSDVRSLRDEPESLHAYLKKVDPAKLPELFGLSLESSTLAQIVESFNEKVLDEHDAQLFKYLQQVNRFATVALFLDGQLKPALDRLVKHAQSSS